MTVHVTILLALNLSFHFQIHLVVYYNLFSFCLLLGDLLDEGKWCSDEEFQDHVDRFNTLFQVSGNTQRHLIVGNHDIGYHYMYAFCLTYMILYIKLSIFCLIIYLQGCFSHVCKYIPFVLKLRKIAEKISLDSPNQFFKFNSE